MYNISEHSITKQILFFINKEFEVDVLLKIKKYEELVLYIVTEVDKIHKL